MSKLTVEAKACPFCGKTKLSIDCKSKNAHKGYHQTFSVRCNSCFARGGTVSGYIKPKSYFKDEITLVSESELINKAIDLWNTRVNN